MTIMIMSLVSSLYSFGKKWSGVRLLGKCEHLAGALLIRGKADHSHIQTSKECKKSDSNHDYCNWL